jgi:hypothetical protein
MPDSINSMTSSRSHASSLKLLTLTCLAMVLLSLIPQINLWLERGRNWNGAYVTLQSDEPIYSAYVNALINGRARKNDPFGGRDDSAEAPLPESIFSIQFVPAYAIAMRRGYSACQHQRPSLLSAPRLHYSRVCLFFGYSILLPTTPA